MRNREECRSGSKYNLMQKTSPLFERIGLWARGKSAGVSETSFCGLQRERGRFGLARGGDPIMLKRVLLYKLCTNKKEDKNEAESSLR